MTPEMMDYVKKQVIPAHKRYMADLSQQPHPLAAALTDQLRQHGYDALDEYNHPSLGAGPHIHVRKQDSEEYPQFMQKMQTLFGDKMQPSPMGEDGQHSPEGLQHGVDGADFVVPAPAKGKQGK